MTLQEQRKVPEAELLLRESLDIRRKTLPKGHRDLASSLRELGCTLSNKGLAEAEPLFRESIENYRMGRTVIELCVPPARAGQVIRGRPTVSGGRGGQ